MVDTSQQQQLEELQEIAHSTFKECLPGLDEVDRTLASLDENSKEKNDIDKSS